MMAFSKVVVQSSYGRGFPGLSMNFLSLPSIVIYCVSARGNNGSTGPFEVCIVQMSLLPLKDWATALDYLKFIKSYICEVKWLNMQECGNCLFTLKIL